MLVAWLVAVTVRPGTAAPDSSDTMPVIEAKPVCAPAAVGRTGVASATRVSWRANSRIARHMDPPDGNVTSMRTIVRGANELPRLQNEQRRRGAYNMEILKESNPKE